MLRLDDSWAEHPQGHLMMADTYYNPNAVLEAGLEPLIRGMIGQRKGRVEPRFSLAMAGNFAGPSCVNGKCAWPDFNTVTAYFTSSPWCVLSSSLAPNSLQLQV